MNQNGFTLIEIMVSVSIFVIVALITTGALVTVSDVNRKAQAIKIAMDNVSFAMDSMVFNLRDGAEFGCFNGERDFNNAVDELGEECNGGENLVFKSKRINSGGGDAIIVYRFNPGNSTTPGAIQFASSDNSEYINITSPEVDITDLRFYVPGTTILGADPKVPRATIIARGEVAGKSLTEFNLQTSVKANF